MLDRKVHFLGGEESLKTLKRQAEEDINNRPFKIRQFLTTSLIADLQPFSEHIIESSQYPRADPNLNVSVTFEFV